MFASSPILAALHQSTLTCESLRGRIDGLWQVLESVTDPRDPRGVRYPLPLLLIMALLVMAQMQSFRLSLIVFAAAPLGLIGVVAVLVPLLVAAWISRLLS